MIIDPYRSPEEITRHKAGLEVTLTERGAFDVALRTIYAIDFKDDFCVHVNQFKPEPRHIEVTAPP